MLPLVAINNNVTCSPPWVPSYLNPIVRRNSSLPSDGDLPVPPQGNGILPGAEAFCWWLPFDHNPSEDGYSLTHKEILEPKAVT